MYTSVCVYLFLATMASALVALRRSYISYIINSYIYTYIYIYMYMYIYIYDAGLYVYICVCIYPSPLWHRQSSLCLSGTPFSSPCASNLSYIHLTYVYIYIYTLPGYMYTCVCLYLFLTTMASAIVALPVWVSFCFALRR